VDASLPARAPSRLRRWVLAFSVGFTVSWLLSFLPFLVPLIYLIPLSLKPGLETMTALLFGLLTLVCHEREHLGPGSLKVLRGWALLGIVGLALLFVFQNRFIVRFNHFNSSGRASEIIASPRFENCPGCETKTKSDEACLEEKSLNPVVLARCWDSSRRTRNQTAWTLAYLMTTGGAASFLGLLWLRLGKARPVVIQRGKSDGHPLFISHAHEDAQAAERIVAYLESHGVPCWISSRDIPPRRMYPDVITEAIQTCSACAVLITSASKRSKEVKREVGLASRYDKPFIPIHVDGSDPGTELDYYLLTSQWVDYHREGERALDRIVQAKDPPTPPTAAASLSGADERTGESSGQPLTGGSRSSTDGMRPGSARRRS
jgi:hypothetical protein